MTTPERIWANIEETDAGEPYIEFLSDEPWSEENPGVEYTRADIHDALRAEVERLREALTKIGKQRYGLQGIQEDYGHDSNAYNYHAKEYFQSLAFTLQSAARRALVTPPACQSGEESETACEGG